MTQEQEDQWTRMVQKQEVQWARMAEQVDTTFREVLFQMSQANSVRLLPWFLSATASSSAGLSCSVSETLTTVMQPKVDAPMDDTTPEFQGTTAPVSMNSPVYRPALCLQFSLCQISQPLVLQSGTHFSHSPLIPNTRNGTAPPVPHLKVKAARGPALALKKKVSAVSAALHISSWQAAIAPNNLSLNLSISPPVQSRLLPNPIMGWLQRPQAAP